MALELLMFKCLSCDMVEDREGKVGWLFNLVSGDVIVAIKDSISVEGGCCLR